MFLMMVRSLKGGRFPQTVGSVLVNIAGSCSYSGQTKIYRPRECKNDAITLVMELICLFIYVRLLEIGATTEEEVNESNANKDKEFAIFNNSSSFSSV